MINYFMDDVPLRILLLIFLTFCNAFFACAEIALLQLNDAKYKKLAEDGDKKAKRIVKLTSDSGKLLSNIQVGVTLSGFLSSAFASEKFSDMIATAVTEKWPSVPFSLIDNISVILITIVLSYFTLVFGELVPKRLALKKCDSVAAAAVGPLTFTGVLFSPFIKILSFSVNLVLKILRIDPKETEEDVTEEDIKLMVNESQEQGHIDDEESELINNVFDFGETTAGEIMVHRTEVVAIPVDCSYDKLMNLAMTERFSRIPVYRETIDDIIGLVHTKSLIGLEEYEFNLEDMILPVFNVPDSQRIDDVLKLMKVKKCHLAVVLDEFGGTRGIITMEDIIEELVGNIQDEYDETEEVPEDTIKKIDDCIYVIDGSTEIDDINEKLELEIPNDEYNTLSGFAVDQLGEIPPEGSNPDFTYDNLKFTVLESNMKVITSIKLEILPIEETEVTEEE